MPEMEISLFFAKEISTPVCCIWVMFRISGRKVLSSCQVFNYYLSIKFICRFFICFRPAVQFII